MREDRAPPLRLTRVVRSRRAVECGGNRKPGWPNIHARRATTVLNRGGEWWLQPRSG